MLRKERQHTGGILFFVMVLMGCGRDTIESKHTRLRQFNIVDAQRDQAAKTLLSTKCAACHGFATDVQKMINTGRILPGDAAHSSIYQRMENGSMPPSGGLTTSDIQLIKDWIDIDLVPAPLPVPPPPAPVPPPPVPAPPPPPVPVPQPPAPVPPHPPHPVPPPPPPAPGTSDLCYQGTIRPIIANNCLSCHGAGKSYPTLDSYSAVMAVKLHSLVAIQSGRMPATGVWTSTENKRILMDWLNQSEPKDSCVITPTPPPPTPTPPPIPMPGIFDLPRVDHEIWSMALELQPDEMGDVMYSEVLPFGGEANKTYFLVGAQVDAVEVTTGNVSPLLHHLLVTRGAPNRKPSIWHPRMHMESTKKTPFIDFLFGLDPVEDLLSKLIGPNMNLYGGNVKGLNSFIFPEGYGSQIKGNDTLNLSVHFNTLFAPQNTDRNVRIRVRYMFAESIEHLGYAVLTVDPKWILAPHTMTIPKNDPSVTLSHVSDPWVWTRSKSKELVLFGVLYHMHTLGVAGKATLIQGDDETVINEDAHFNYANQYVHTLPTPITLKKGRAKLNTECTWDNSQQNQPVVNGKQVPSTDVIWGEGTLDEMCMSVYFLGETGPVSKVRKLTIMDKLIQMFM